MTKTPSIECKPNGPYLVKDLETFRNSADGIIPTQPIMALCRCGGSANKPFCDGSHRSIGVKDEKN